VFIRNVLFFVITGVYGEIGTCSKQGDRCGDPWEDQEVMLCCIYTPVSKDSLILVNLVKRIIAELKARANERSIIGGKLMFHILPPKCLSSRRNLLVYWVLPCDPHFPTLSISGWRSRHTTTVGGRRGTRHGFLEGGGIGRVGSLASIWGYGQSC